MNGAWDWHVSITCTHVLCSELGHMARVDARGNGKVVSVYTRTVP